MAEPAWRADLVGTGERIVDVRLGTDCVSEHPVDVLGKIDRHPRGTWPAAAEANDACTTPTAPAVRGEKEKAP